jgi:quinol monooxygenase YgiN
VLVEAKAIDGNRAPIVEAFKHSQARSASWEGCVQFEVTVSADDPNLVIVAEIWESRAHHAEEVARITGSPLFQRFRKLLSADLRFTYLDIA